jgi:hypothetical protein
MTSERLFSILNFVASLDKTLGLQTKLEAVRDALNNIAGQPAQASYQSTLAAALAAFTEAVSKLPTSITPSQAAAIREIGGEDFFEPALGEKVVTSIQTHAMTPSVARDFVQELSQRRAAFLETVRSARQSLEKLQIKESRLGAGTADVAFIIPRNIFKNQLGDFAKELNFISRLIQRYAEAKTGETKPVSLEQLSSSIPTVSLVADLMALGVLATVIQKFLTSWKTIEEIREIRSRLSKIGMKGTALKELDTQVETTITTVVEESTTLVMKDYPGSSAERRNELEGFVRHDTKQLFGQIERGLNVEFRADPTHDADEATQQLLQGIANVAKELKYPAPTDEPLLLTDGQVLNEETQDGSLTVLHTKKTTKTEKTTTTAKKDGREG